jgi:uncharacterized protein involved in exopolysaccharide biosynthesis
MQNADDSLISIDFLGALRRRKLWGIAVLALGIPATLAVALILPPQYQSSATILIEEPDVPTDLVKSTVSTFASQRLQVIQQRVMTNENLSAIIDRFGLYQTALQTKPRSEVIDNMRNNIDLEVVSANLTGQAPTKQQQQQSQASIAFTVSFTSGDPQSAQLVTNRLMDLYLAENARNRQEKAAGTTEFLTAESTKLFNDVQDFNNQLSAFRSKYAGSLPEQMGVNMQLMNQMQSQLLQSRGDMQAMLDKKSFLESQLAQLSPYQSVNAEGKAATPQAQLMSLELQYVDLSSKYGPKHPDVVKVQKQIATLKQSLGSGGGTTPAQTQLNVLQSQLADALQKYGENHPSVVKLRAQIADLQTELAKAPAETTLTAPKGPPDNPIYIQFTSELADVNAKLRGLTADTSALQARLTDLQQKVLQTSAIESEYNSLVGQYNAAVQRYQSFKDKEADARVAENMEQQNKSETFSVIEPPDLPVVPIKPNRKLVIAAGIVVFFGLAVGLMLAIELLDPRIYTAAGLEHIFGEAPLVMMPYITNRAEIRRRRLRYAGATLATVLVVGGGLYYFNQSVMPLDVAYAAFVNRINP